MRTRELEEKLSAEVGQWSAKEYAELTQLRYPIAYDSGDPPASPGYYETKVNILERTADWVHLVVAVYDGETRDLHRISDDFLVYARGGGEA